MILSKRNLSAILIFFLVQSYAYSRNEDLQASYHLDRAFSYYYKEKVPEAKAAFQKYLTLKGDQEVPLRYLARLHLSQGDMKSAIGYLERAVKADPQSITSLLLISEVYLKQNDFDNASVYLERILTLDTFHERALSYLAYLYQQKKEDRKASAYYKRLILATQKGSSNDDILEQCYYNLGNYYYNQDNYARALQYYQKLADLNPFNYRYLILLGEIHKVMGNFHESARALEKLLQKQPDYLSALESISETYYIINDSRAKVFLEKYIAKSKRSSQIHEVLLTELNNDDEKAMKLTLNLLKTNPNRFSARIALLKLHKKKKDIEKIKNEAFALTILSQRIGAYEMARIYAHNVFDIMLEESKNIKYDENFLKAPTSAFPGEEHLRLALDYAELYATHAATLENLSEKKASITYYSLASEVLLRLIYFNEKSLQKPGFNPQSEEGKKLIKTVNVQKAQLYQVYVNWGWAVGAQKGREPEGLVIADKGIALFPDFATAHFVKGVILNALAEKKKELYSESATHLKLAIDHSSRKTKEKHAPPNYYFYYGMVLEKLDRFPEAEVSLKRSIEIDPYNPTYLNFLGYMYSLKNMKLDEADKLLLTALEDDPDNEAYLDSYGHIQYKLGNYKLALEKLIVAYTMAQKKGVQDSVIYFHLAETYFKLEDFVSAHDYYAKTLDHREKASEPLDVNYINDQLKIIGERQKNKKAEKNSPEEKPENSEKDM